MPRRWTVWGLIGAMFVVAGSLLAPQLALAETNIWHESWEKAATVAEDSGKPIYVYIYQVRGDREGTAHNSKQYNPCEKMNRLTLANQQVKQMLDSYVLCALDVGLSRTWEFIDKHAPELVSEGHGDHAVAASYRLPFHLFFDSSGGKAFQLYGYIPAQWFVQTIEAVNMLIGRESSTEAQLKQARAYARLGHLCLELELYNEGKKNLKKAIKLDPQNKAGARADAELDLAIMSLPDDPDGFYRSMQDYLSKHPDSPRHVEVRYFMAAAKYVAGDMGKAIEILEKIAQIEAPAGSQEARWVENAVVLLDQLRRSQK